jgi:hypothetical protein
VFDSSRKLYGYSYNFLGKIDCCAAASAGTAFGQQSIISAGNTPASRGAHKPFSIGIP